MKKHLYYYNWQLDVSIFGVILDDLKKRQKQDEKIYFLSCDGILKPCWNNNTGKKSLCDLCAFHNKTAFSNLDVPVIHLNLKDYIDESHIIEIFDSLKYEYKSFKEIKKIKYKGISIGYGALSSYISWTRNIEPVYDIQFKSFINLLLKSEVLLKEAIDNIIAELNPDTITIFNGRTADVLPVFETSLQAKIPLRGIENILPEITNYRKRIFPEVLPQNIDFQTTFINNHWNNSAFNDNQKIEIASSFFERRKNAILTMDVRVYVANQKKNKLPADWDSKRKNIVIFNSSEDEYASIDEDFDKKSLYETQEQGIIDILENVKDENIHFYLRVHPNLENVIYGYHLRLDKLSENYSNITVIDAKSTVSTYSLMEKADKVIVFGSTMGAEACYWKKPVIQLAGSLYYHLEVAYTPKTKETLYEMIRAKLDPKEQTGALKFGFYLMDHNNYTEEISTNPVEIKMFGFLLGHKFPFMKLFGSSLFFKVYSKIRFQLINKILNYISPEKCFQIPTKGY